MAFTKESEREQKEREDKERQDKERDERNRRQTLDKKDTKESAGKYDLSNPEYVQRAMEPGTPENQEWHAITSPLATSSAVPQEPPPPPEENPTSRRKEGDPRK